MGITEHPDQRFMTQTARNETMEDGGWLHQLGTRYIIHDRDTKYRAAWRHILHNAGVEPLAIPANSSNVNAFAERWVRTVKRECLRRVHVLGLNRLRRVLTAYVEHYHAERPHQSLDNKPPTTFINKSFDAKAPAQKYKTGVNTTVFCRARCGGAIRHYYRSAA